MRCPSRARLLPGRPAAPRPAGSAPERCVLHRALPVALPEDQPPSVRLWRRLLLPERPLLQGRHRSPPSPHRPALWHRLIDEWTPTVPARTRRSPAPREAQPPEVRRGRRGRPWRRARAAVLARSTVCWICAHEGADSVDHLVPLSQGGDPLDPGNLAPAHYRGCPTCGRRCNITRGARDARGEGTTEGGGSGGTGRHPGSPGYPPPHAPATERTPIASDAW